MPIWSQFVDFLEWVLTTIASVVQNGGLAIIVFTILVKTLLLPLTLKSVKSTKAMQELQPKMKELQKKYGKDREELSRRTMELYAQYQVNPLSGCLPLLIQMPIFFGVYRAVINLSNSNTGHFADGFLWLDSLGSPDPYKILPIAAGLFQFIQMRMTRPANAPAVTDPQQRVMNSMLNVMPLMAVIFGWAFASGAVIYWTTSSLYSIVQQWLIGGWGSLNNWFPWLPELPEHRRLGYQAPRNLDEVVVEYDSEGRPRPTGFMGRLQKRLEETQAQAERQGAAREGTVAKATATAGGTRTPAAKPTGNRKNRSGKSASYQQRVDQAAQSADVEAVTEEAPAADPKRDKKRATYDARVTAASRRGPRSTWSQPEPKAGKPATAPGKLATAGSDSTDGGDD